MKSKKLKKLILERGTIKDAAEQYIGVTRQYLTDVCNNKVIPGRKTATKIHKYIKKEMTVAEIMGL
jgi:DNA-binding XRE family transcriptional regulator